MFHKKLVISVFFKKKQTLAVPGHIFFHFKMKLIFVETFLEICTHLTKKMNEQRKKIDL